MGKPRKNYTATYDRDEDGWWVVSIQEVPGCHSQGRTLKSARTRIREALGLFVTNARNATILDDVRVPPATDKLVREALAAGARARKEQECARVSMERGARALHAIMGLRDAAEILDISPQRVQQVIHAK